VPLFFCALCFFSLFSSLVCSLTFPLGEWSSLERTRGDKAREGTRARERERVLSWWPSRKKISLSPYIYVFFLFFAPFFFSWRVYIFVLVYVRISLFFLRSHAWLGREEEEEECGGVRTKHKKRAGFSKKGKSKKERTFFVQEEVEREKEREMSRIAAMSFLWFFFYFLFGFSLSSLSVFCVLCFSFCFANRRPQLFPSNALCAQREKKKKS